MCCEPVAEIYQCCRIGQYLRFVGFSYAVTDDHQAVDAFNSEVVHLFMIYEKFGIASSFAWPVFENSGNQKVDHMLAAIGPVQLFKSDLFGNIAIFPGNIVIKEPFG